MSRTRKYYGFHYPTVIDILDTCSKTEIIDFIVKHTNKLDFNQKDDNWLRKWNVFNNIKWKNCIKFSLIDSTNCKDIKYGKLFNESHDGIYDFATGIIPFGNLSYNINSINVCSQHGIIVLNIDYLKIYCYYWVNMGGCPSCGMDSIIGKPYDVKLYMCESIEGIISYCMSEFDRVELLNKYYNKMIENLQPLKQKITPLELLTKL